MAKPSFKFHRRCLDYAEVVAKIAREAPDDVTRRELYAVANSVRKRFGFTEADKQREVALRIMDGASTIADIIAETNFHRDDVHAIAKQFEQLKAVTFSQIRSGDRGRPSVCIFPTARLSELFPPKS